MEPLTNVDFSAAQRRCAARLPGACLVAALAAMMLFAGSALAEGLPDFTKLVEQSSPAVVNISTTMKKPDKPQLPDGLQMPDIPEDSPLHDFFKRFFGENGPQEPEPRSSLGSGFIISKDGYVVTNYHVIKDADQIIVRLSDRREFEATVVGSDQRSDLAVLHIKAHNLPVVKIGNSHKLKVGEWVLAIGSPFGFDHSVTAGIVSAKGRSLPNENYIPFIQTDVAINPGNSGGPLLNLEGEVVGVNSQIYSRTGGFMGLSFAIPIDMVMNVYQQLRETGHVTRGWLGVLIQDVTRELAESFGMKKPYGALVAKVLPGSPAAKAGLKTGDVVVAFNGQTIDLSADLPPLVGNTRVGTSVPVEIIRDGHAQQLSVTVGKLPQQGQLKQAEGGSPKRASDNRLGIAVKDLSKDERKKLDLQDHGVLVTEVEKGAGYSAGVRTGDVILMLDNVKVGNVAEFKKIMAGLPAGKSVAILIQRRGGPMFLAMKVPEKK